MNRTKIWIKENVTTEEEKKLSQKQMRKNKTDEQKIEKIEFKINDSSQP